MSIKGTYSGKLYREFGVESSCSEVQKHRQDLNKALANRAQKGIPKEIPTSQLREEIIEDFADNHKLECKICGGRSCDISAS